MRLTAALLFVLAGSAAASGQTVLFSNGGFITHSGQGAGGADVSQMDNNFFGLGNVVAHTNPGPEYRGAEDFIVPAGETWQVDRIRVFAYNQFPGGSVPPPPFSAIEMKIWNGDPRQPASQNIATSTTLGATAWTNSYRVEAGLLQQDIRPIYSAEALFSNLELEAGTYWIDFQITGGFAVTPYVMDGLLNATGNAMVLFSGSVGWYPTQYGNPARGIAYPFMVEGSLAGSQCYANCDGSTVAPILNVADFGCFLAKFAAGDSYANCDGSTVAPVLNVADFGCFLAKFAGGCQ